MPGAPTAYPPLATPTASFSISGAGSADATVHDSSTGLTWQQVISPKKFSWDDRGSSPDSAQYYCAHLSLGNVIAGWRLPSKKELLSIVSAARSAPAIDVSVFPRTPANGYFWTATPAGHDAAWYIYFNDGQAYINNTGYRYSVRCVR
jgi:hypothetical protein